MLKNTPFVDSSPHINFASQKQKAAARSKSLAQTAAFAQVTLSTTIKAGKSRLPKNGDRGGPTAPQNSKALLAKNSTQATIDDGNFGSFQPTNTTKFVAASSTAQVYQKVPIVAIPASHLTPARKLTRPADVFKNDLQPQSGLVVQLPSVPLTVATPPRAAVNSSGNASPLKCFAADGQKARPFPFSFTIAKSGFFQPQSSVNEGYDDVPAPQPAKSRKIKQPTLKKAFDFFSCASGTHNSPRIPTQLATSDLHKLSPSPLHATASKGRKGSPSLTSFHGVFKQSPCLVDLSSANKPKKKRLAVARAAEAAYHRSSQPIKESALSVMHRLAPDAPASLVKLVKALGPQASIWSLYRPMPVKPRHQEGRVDDKDKMRNECVMCEYTTYYSKRSRLARKAKDIPPNAGVKK